MKKVIIGIVIVLIVGIAVWWFYPGIFKRQGSNVPQQSAEREPSPPAPPAFDTSDNLDQALQDLEGI